MTPRTRLAVNAALATLAGATALGAAFATLGWLPPAVAAVALVVALLEACRRLRVPSFLGVVIALVGLLAFLTRGWASAHAWVGFLPTGASLRDLAGVARDGFRDASELAAPVPTTRGLVLITVAGIALLAIAVDLLAVTAHRPALVGMPLLAVFCVGSAVSPHGAGWLPFAIGAVGYQRLLVADGRQRISRWGRALGFDRSARMATTWSAEGAGTSPVSVLARRIGVPALAAAVVVPALVPGLSGTLAAKSGGDGTGGGSSTVTTYNPIVRIRDQLHTAKPIPVLRMRSTESNPDYVRLTSLDRFDGSTWSASPITADSRTRVSRGLPPVTTDATTTTVRTHIDIRSLDVHWLPLPYPPASVSVKGAWLYDAASGTVFSSRRSTKNLSYDVTSTRLLPTAQQLADAPDPDRNDPHSSLPLLDPRVVDEAQRVTADAATSFDKAVALQRYFTSGRFVYDDTVPASDAADALSSFLFDTRRGFCEQYAAAMAVMARAVGIPARVAVGFTRGTKQADGTWLVTTHDAHAWPELWFPGVGWVRFEPTPAGGADGQALPPSYSLAPGGGSSGQAGSDTPNGQSAGGSKGLGTKRDQMLNRGEDNPVVPVPASVVARRGSHTGAIALTVGVVLLLLLASPALARLAVRRRRWRRAGTEAQTAHAAWSQLHDDARDLGLDWRPSDTPRTAVAALGGQVGGWAPGAGDAARRLARAEERATYSPGGPGDVTGLREDLLIVRAALAAEVGAVRRIRAVVLPPSSLRRARRAGGRAADVLDRSELAVAGLRRAVPHPRVAGSRERAGRRVGSRG